MSELLIIGSGPVRHPLTNGLVSYHALNEASAGNNAIDSHIYGLTATDFNTVGTGTGLIDNCRNFVAASSQHFARTDGTPWAITGQTQFMISVWVRMASKPANGTIVKREQGTPIEGHFNLGYTGGATDRFRIAINRTTATNDTALGAPSLNTWYHLLAWRDATNIGLRINDQYETTLAHNNVSVSVAALAPFVIGATKTEGGTVSNLWDGDINHLAFWIGRTKTSVAATYLYNGGNPLPYLSYFNKGFDF